MADVPPIRREIVVDAMPEIAFAVFTEGLGGWWPLADFGVFNDGTVALLGDRIVETSSTGEQTVWGTVTERVPPHRLVFTWHPGTPQDRASTVEVRFAAVGLRTAVTLVHRGWEGFADPAAARNEYDHGWPQVLAAYAVTVGDRSAPQDGVEAAQTWVALFHTPAEGVDGPVFADARFAHHIAFLQRMHRSGYLEAAGSFDDGSGQGMTILRLPGEGRLEDARALAEADLSVVEGLFALRVRGWGVALSR